MITEYKRLCLKIGVISALSNVSIGETAHGLAGTGVFNSLLNAAVWRLSLSGSAVEGIRGACSKSVTKFLRSTM